jgi:DNA-binding CsgD family transcriptional regulator
MRINALIEAIYEAALRPAGWQSVVRATASLLGARDGSFASYNFKTGAFAIDCTPIDPEYSRSYDERWAHNNFLWQATHRLPVGTLFNFEAAMPRAQFENTVFFKEWWLPQGMVWALGSNLIANEALSSVATFHRPANRPDFNQTDVAKFRVLLPHLSRAMEIRQQIEAGSGIAEDFRAALEALRKPALLVDRDCKLQFANTPADVLMQAGDLKPGANLQIVARIAEQTRLLHRLVGEIFHNGNAGGNLALQRPTLRPLTLTVARLHRSASPFARESALILVDDPEQRASTDAPHALLQALYRLTHSEAELAVLIGKGKRVGEAAEERGICLATARTHLAHVFQKTGVSTQAELIRLLIASGINVSSGEFS